MSWELTGTYFEHCPCDMVCPCTTSGLTKPADVDRCTVVLAFNLRPAAVSVGPVLSRSPVAAKKAVASLLSR